MNMSNSKVGLIHINITTNIQERSNDNKMRTAQVKVGRRSDQLLVDPLRP